MRNAGIACFCQKKSIGRQRCINWAIRNLYSFLQKEPREILNRKKVAVAGSRKIEYRTAGVAARLGEKMAAEKLAMVCGGASGVDQIAQDALLDAGGVLILIPAVEADQILPQKKGSGSSKKETIALGLRDIAGCAFLCAEIAYAQSHNLCNGRAAIVVASRKNMGGSWQRNRLFAKTAFRRFSD